MVFSLKGHKPFMPFLTIWILPNFKTQISFHFPDVKEAAFDFSSLNSCTFLQSGCNLGAYNVNLHKRNSRSQE